MTELTTIEKKVRDEFFSRAAAQETVRRGVENNVQDFESSSFADVGTVCETFGARTADTNDLDIEMWSMGIANRNTDNTANVLGPAQVLREDVKYKMIPSIKLEQQSAYEKLNSYMARCIPNEYREDQPRSVARDPKNGSQINSSDFRWAGDIAGIVATGRAKNAYMQLIRNVLKGAAKFIEFLAPVESNSKVEVNPIETKTEGDDMYVDIKGSKIVKVDNAVETKNV